MNGKKKKVDDNSYSFANSVYVLSTESTVYKWSYSRNVVFENELTLIRVAGQR